VTGHPAFSPLPGAASGLASARPGPDLTAAGFGEQEYVATGSAVSYAADDLPADGHWTLREAGEAPYATRVVVRRPIDPTVFSGQQAYVVRAALRHLDTWARGGAAAPGATPLVVVGDRFETDANGNAAGGVRTPAPTTTSRRTNAPPTPPSRPASCWPTTATRSWPRRGQS
jgi:hypothetical protein